MAEILIAEDAPSIREGVKSLLEGDFHSVRAVSDGTDAVALYRRYHPDLVILDVMMPGMDGFDVLKTIRQRDPETPVLLLTARIEEADVVVGFGLGCDDYLKKPFSSRELLCRVTTLLRRTAATRPGKVVREEDLEFAFCGGRVVPLERMFVSEHGKVVHLSDSELKLARLLAQNANHTVRKEVLLQSIWCGYTVLSRSVETHVANIRRKVGRWGRTIHNIYGIGYKYVPGNAALTLS